MSIEIGRTAHLETSTSSPLPSLPGGAVPFSALAEQESSGLDREVRALIDGALSWVMDNLEEFDPFRGGRPFEMRHGQKVAELATMAHAYVELTGDSRNPDMERIYELLRAVRQNRELGDRLLRAPGELVLYFILYVVLRSRGDDEPAQRELLQRALATGFLEHSERVDHRRMDVSLHLEWGGFDHPWPTLEELYESSILGRDASPLYLDENAVYAVTHIFMFLYGFGLREADVPHARSEGVRRLLSDLLVAACQEHHWDLLGELLLCWECVDLPPSPMFERSWRELLAVQNVNGAVPGPESALAAGSGGGRPLHADSAAPDPQPDFFAHHYHTTLVSILAGSLYLNRSMRGQGQQGRQGLQGQEQQRKPRRSPPVREAVGRSRRWLGELLERDEASPEDLCRLLLGCWICDSFLGAADTELPGTARQIGERLLELDRSGARFDGIPATLRLLAVALLAAEGIAVPALLSFAIQSAEVLGDLPLSGDRSDLPLMEKRILLDAMGLLPAAPAENAEGTEEEGFLDFARGFSLAAPRPEVEALASWIEAWTRSGTQAVELAPADTWISEMVAGLAVHSLRQYNFVTASKLMRCLVYLGGGEETYQDCAAFLCLHQRPEGSFGFFGPEEGKLRATGMDVASADLSLYLPITVSCLWALAEGEPSGWRLYGSLPRFLPEEEG